MNRAYMHLLDKAADCQMYVVCIVKNANYKEGCDQVTRPRLQTLIQALENVRRELQDVVSEQMKAV